MCTYACIYICIYACIYVYMTKKRAMHPTIILRRRERKKETEKERERESERHPDSKLINTRQNKEE